MPILSACSVELKVVTLGKKEGKISLVWKCILHLPMHYSLAIACLSLGCSGLKWDANLTPAIIWQDNQRSPDQNNKLGVLSCPGRNGGFGKAGTFSCQEGLVN